ncbi:acyltransferase [Desulforamulus hydrothermalis]|uniref:Acyltransferase 3 n=1 Tax=Desulforamulus hydrothermalis Lam5 = DSM 18033 TaxID=1121428 RepID=K8DXZ3_9FIRM|nr:acyltransferase [Desulforamulus hydrothermalis]CCO07627.1 Acyltransferase 3 [Desulforamulus hydrothermalis Lam5 = DSM 18033]SHH19585.1 Surface polysaccharide O-acyltransferase, integral membrane enzyme [Desulforamulus hydrothermalis Lam5 = DSM 18033]
MKVTDKPSLAAVEITRGMAILAVLLIHISGLPLRLLAPGSGEHFFYTLLNRGMQFAVPLFLMISALVLAYRSGQADLCLAEFYRRRWRRAVLPFMVWTTLYLALRFWVLHDIPYFSLKQGLLWYIFGKGFFHLYFLSVVIQFYLLFPLLHRWWRAWQPGFLTVLLLFGAGQVAFYWLNRLYLYQHFTYTGSLLFSYWLPIGCGLWLGYNTAGWDAWWRRRRLYCLVLAAAAGAFYLNRHFAILAGVKISTFYYQMAWALYVTALGTAVIFLARRLAAGGPAVGFFGWLGRYSYGIYLIHPFYLLMWQKLVVPHSPAALHLAVAGGLAAVTVLSWLTTRLLERTALAGLLYGVNQTRPSGLFNT